MNSEKKRGLSRWLCLLGMIVERTQTGKMAARQNPNFRDGRPKKFTPAQIDRAMALLSSGKTYREVEAMTGISKSTLIRARRKGIIIGRRTFDPSA